jgi:hypothetical protein
MYQTLRQFAELYIPQTVDIYFDIVLQNSFTFDTIKKALNTLLAGTVLNAVK